MTIRLLAIFLDRTVFPQLDLAIWTEAESALQDELCDNSLRNNLRLEREKIGLQC